MSWTAHADAAGAALTDTGPFDGITPALTGAEAFDYADIAALVSVLAGRKITRVTVSDEEWTQRLVGQSTPPASADMAPGIFRQLQGRVRSRRPHPTTRAWTGFR